MDIEPREDLLFERVLDRSDRPADWRDLDRAAGEDPELWQRLVAHFRDDAELRAAVAPRLAVAELVEAPHCAPSRPWGAWSGWAAAAALFVAWLTGGASPDRARDLPLLRPLADAPAVTAGLPSGPELPGLLVEAQPVGDGSRLKVVYMRRFLEEMEIDRAAAIRADGRRDPVNLTAQFAVLETPTDF